ncbi:MAG: YggS family pyridoxal phosphate-dependent enzyme [Acidaminococcaceae bacterium]|jgi:pyridoxal phosphate enzyme (YggS family)|nr:YggS family pyridoxal phosphate-dependent enzyme [Acidaminococcaceae bacterium]
MLAENLQKVQQNITQALAHRSEPKCTGTGVLLVAVTKNHPAAVVTDIQNLRVMDVGENRVQEARDKQKVLGHHGTWHLIGHLQTNKAKQAVELFDIIESVDSEHLLLALDKEAGKLGKRMDVLLQINIAGEVQKTGFAPADYEAILPQLDKFTNIRVRGLMVIAPQTDQVESVRPVFKEGYRYFCALRKVRPAIDYLSMGMTEDYQVAIEEGANVVRIGTALFGPRDYSKH